MIDPLIEEALAGVGTLDVGKSGGRWGEGYDSREKRHETGGCCLAHRLCRATRTPHTGGQDQTFKAVAEEAWLGEYYL